MPQINQPIHLWHMNIEASGQLSLAHPLTHHFVGQ